jgi:hypothetical protein
MIKSQANANGQSQDLKAAHLHAILKVVLATFVKAQKEGSLDDILLTLGKHIKCVNLEPVCFLVIGEMQAGGNSSSCRPASYSNIQQSTCAVYIMFTGYDTAGDPFMKFQKMSMIKIMELESQNWNKILKGIHQCNVPSAWFDVGYSGYCSEIFSAATPVAPLPALENGLIAGCGCTHSLLEKEITSKQKRALLGALLV